ncbi:peroxiredoxin Prx1p, mitochondrial [Trichomonascus vanleenenianus]|uniref:peroxiredoxin Prx1p, mitochondrial n=1 Tax=Trichomonascus vanleenenianus TaxID=2268995 RepID=UPI003ECB0751
MLRYTARFASRRVSPAMVRFNSSFAADKQPRVRIGSVAPNFKAVTTQGDIDFHDFIGDSWTILFSHPADFTPVCTTELGAFAALKDEFTKRNTKLIGLSSDPIESHHEWVKDIEEAATQGKKFDFPVIADADRKIAYLYDMVDEEGFKNLAKGPVFTIRNVFIIDPAKKVRLFMVYPASTGRNTAEVLRVLDALQLTDRTGLVTPVDWTKGQDVIVPPSVKTADAEAKYGKENVREVKSYLRYTPEPKEEPLKSSFAPTGSKYVPLMIGGAVAFVLLSGGDSKKENSLVEDLKNVIGKVLEGKEVDVRKELKTGDRLTEQQWDELMKRIEQSKEYHGWQDEKSSSHNEQSSNHNKKGKS